MREIYALTPGLLHQIKPARLLSCANKYHPPGRADLVSSIRKGPEWPRTYKYNASPNILAITIRMRASKELEACTTGSDGG